MSRWREQQDNALAEGSRYPRLKVAIDITKEAAVGTGCIVAGGLAIHFGQGYGIGTLSNPGDGFAPVLFGALFVLVALSRLWDALRLAPSSERDRDSSSLAVETDRHFQPSSNVGNGDSESVLGLPDVITSDAIDAAHNALTPRDVGRGYLCLALIGIVPALMPRAGFLLAAFLMMLGLLWLLQFRKPLERPIIALLVAVASWGFFSEFLGIRFPRGWLPW